MPETPYTIDGADNDEVPETPAVQPPAEPQKPGVQTLPVVIDSDDDDLKDYKDPKVPATLKESFALLGTVSAMPENTRKAKRVKEKMLAFAKSHCYRLQQGLPDVPVSATMSHFTQQISSLKRERLENLARTNPDVQELVNENTALRARCKELEGAGAQHL